MYKVCNFVKSVGNNNKHKWVGNGNGKYIVYSLSKCFAMVLEKKTRVTVSLYKKIYSAATRKKEVLFKKESTVTSKVVRQLSTSSLNVT